MGVFTGAGTFFLSDEECLNSPSRADGVSEADEFALRLFGGELVQEGGVLLRLCVGWRAGGAVGS